MDSERPCHAVVSSHVFSRRLLQNGDAVLGNLEAVGGKPPRLTTGFLAPPISTRSELVPPQMVVQQGRFCRPRGGWAQHLRTPIAPSHGQQPPSPLWSSSFLAWALRRRWQDPPSSLEVFAVCQTWSASAHLLQPRLSLWRRSALLCCRRTGIVCCEGVEVRGRGCFCFQLLCPPWSCVPSVSVSASQSLWPPHCSQPVSWSSSQAHPRPLPRQHHVRLSAAGPAVSL